MRRALLIGSQINGLTGVHEDLLRVHQALGLFGFERRTIKEGDANRAGILAAIRQFIAATVPGDAVLLYYTGHGGLAVNKHKSSGFLDGSAPPAQVEPNYFQYIVPTDHKPEDFKGIFSVELSALLAELTTITRNVTVILDCCHATGIPLAGDRDFIARGVPKPWAGDIRGHVDWLRAQGYDLNARVMDVESNPHAIRLVACAADETAYESRVRGKVLGGLLTEVFVQILHEARPLPTMPAWDALNKLIRERVRKILLAQNPDVQGPLGRRLFSVEETTRTDVFAYAEEGGRPLLRGGALHGIRAGDQFLVMPIEAATPDQALALARLEAHEVHMHLTFVAVTAITDRPAVTAGARAFRIHTSYPRHNIIVVVDGPPGAALRAAIAASPRLALGGPDAPALATLTTDAAGALALRDEHGVLTRRVADFEADAARSIVLVLEQLARVRELLDTRSGVGDSLLHDAPSVQWGRLGPAGREPLPLHGARLQVGDRIYIEVALTSDLPIHLSILGVGVDRSITLLSGSEPHGVGLAEGETYVLGQDRAGQLLGIPLRWHGDVPTNEPQPLEYLIVATDMPVDMRSLEAAMYEADELFTRARTAPAGSDKDHDTSPDAIAGAAPVVTRSNIRACRVALTHLSARLVAAPEATASNGQLVPVGAIYRL